MNHLDEGTIHAWLDGAVDATRSREIEAHVAQCAQCAAAVAEARGLIAGASRILNALDDVPANVVPKRAPTPKRQWRAAPWVTSIAAALVLAIGVTTWNRNGAQMATEEMATKVERIAAPAAPTPAAVSAQDQVGAAVPPSAAGARGSVASPTRRTIGDAVGKVAGAVSNQAAGPRRPAQRKAAVAQAPSVPAPVAAKDAAMSPAEAKMSARASATALRPMVDTAMRREQTLAAGALDKASAATDVADFAGCYPVPKDARQLELRSVVTTSTGGAEARSATRARVASPAAAPSQARTTEYVEAKPRSTLRLDTLASGGWFAVRSASSDTAIGRWRRVAGDSAQVHILGMRTITVRPGDRVSCPAP